MNAADAMNAALRALRDIDRIAEDGAADPEGAVEEIHDITGDVLGELARAGFTEGGTA